MILEILIAIITGITSGIVTGLIPGLHVNLISVLLLSSAVYLSEIFNGISLVVFIISMALTHTFLDIIPAIFLGAPSPDTALAVLPGHEFLLKGLGFEAVKLATIGSLFGLMFSITLMPLLIFVVPGLYGLLKPNLCYILIIAAVLLVLKEQTTKKKLIALILFSLSGILGYLVLNLEMLKQPLLPLLSGLFGLSTLFISLNKEVMLPKQTIESFIVLKKRNIVKAVLASTFAGWITSMLPAIGAAQAAIFARFFFKKMSKSAYLIVIGGVNTVNFLLSFVTFYTLDKARNGAVITIQQIIGEIGIKELVLFVIIALLVGGIATILTLNLARLISLILPKINYQLICRAIVIFIIGMVMLLSGWLGLIVLVTATAIGLLAPIYQVKRCVLMGCLMLPVIVILLKTSIV